MHYDFIEVGTSDFRAECMSNTGSGITVEPVKAYSDRLPRRDNLVHVIAAISDADGQARVFYVSPTVIDQLGLPWWIRGCSSINQIHPTVARHVSAKMCIVAEVVSSAIVTMYTLATLFSKYEVSSVDILKLDTEGHDCTILKAYFQSSAAMAQRIQFESNSLSDPDEVQETIEIANTKGYSVTISGYDTTLELAKCNRAAS